MPDFAIEPMRSWKDFYDRVYGLNSLAPHKKRSWIFRGQTDDWPLRTSIERKRYMIGKLLQQDVTSIDLRLAVREFRRQAARARVHYRGSSPDTLFCLALMQHYGAPTRLLDCTYSPFVAAAFALEKGFVCSRPVVWCISGEWCENEAKNCSPGVRRFIEIRHDDDHRSDNTFVPLFQFGPRPKATMAKFVKAENPLHLNDRLTTQQGVFLCPADLSVSFEDNLKAMSGCDAASNLVKLTLQLDEPKA